MIFDDKFCSTVDDSIILYTSVLEDLKNNIPSSRFESRVISNSRIVFDNVIRRDIIKMPVEDFDLKYSFRKSLISIFREKELMYITRDTYISENSIGIFLNTKDISTIIDEESYFNMMLIIDLPPYEILMKLISLLNKNISTNFNIYIDCENPLYA